MTSGSMVDLNVYKMGLCKVFKPDGVTFLDVWRDVELLNGFKESINGGTGVLNLTLPRSFDSFDAPNQLNSRGTVAIGNVVQYWLFGPGLPATGKLRYQGRLDAYNPAINASTNEETVVVTVTPFSSVLSDSALGGSVTFTNTDPIAMAQWFFTNNDPNTGVPYMSPLTWSSSNPTSSGIAVTYTFTNQTMDSILKTILQMLQSSGNPNWFYRVNADLTFTLNMAPTTAQHVAQMSQHVTAPAYKQDTTQLKNVIFLTGASTTNNSTNPPTTTTITSVRKGSDVATYGARYALINQSRATTQETADVLCQGALTAQDVIQYRGTVTLPDYRGDANPAIGYDIESLQVGDTFQIETIGIYPQSLWNSMKWNTNAYWDYPPGYAGNSVTIISALTYHFDSVDLELGGFQPSLSRQILTLQQAFQDFTVI